MLSSLRSQLTHSTLATHRKYLNFTENILIKRLPSEAVAVLGAGDIFRNCVNQQKYFKANHSTLGGHRSGAVKHWTNAKLFLVTSFTLLSFQWWMRAYGSLGKRRPFLRENKIPFWADSGLGSWGFQSPLFEDIIISRSSIAASESSPELCANWAKLYFWTHFALLLLLRWSRSICRVVVVYFFSRCYFPFQSCIYRSKSS